MPWKEVGVKDQRISLVARALGGKETMKDLRRLWFGRCGPSPLLLRGTAF